MISYVALVLLHDSAKCPISIQYMINVKYYLSRASRCSSKTIWTFRHQI